LAVGSGRIVPNQAERVGDDVAAIVADNEPSEGSACETGWTIPVLDVKDCVGDGNEFLPTASTAKAGNIGDLVEFRVKMHLEIISIHEEPAAFRAIVVLGSEMIVQAVLALMYKETLHAEPMRFLAMFDHLFL